MDSKIKSNAQSFFFLSIDDCVLSACVLESHGCHFFFDTTPQTIKSTHHDNNRSQDIMKTSLFLGSVWISSTSEAFLFTRNQRNQHPGFLSSHLSKPLESVPKEIAIEGPIEFDRGVEDHSFARVPAVLPETHVWVDAYYSVNDEDAAHFRARTGIPK